jgi:hypothetical protein
MSEPKLQAFCYEDTRGLTWWLYFKDEADAVIESLRNSHRELEAQLRERDAELATYRKLAWQEWKPIINAIGEISVQEAMDAIDRMVG